MTILDSKTNRDLYGIDTFERGFVYSALLLRASNTHPQNTRSRNENPYYNAVRITVAGSGSSALVVIQARIPYISNSVLRSGGNFLKNLGSYQNQNPNPFLFRASPSNPKKLDIPIEPQWVDSLEKYLAWCGTNLIYGFLQLESGNQQGSIQFLEEDIEPTFQINLSLPINYLTYIETSNLFNSVRSVIPFTYSDDELDFTFSNNSIVDNTFLVVN